MRSSSHVRNVFRAGPRVLLFRRCPRNGQGIGIESGNAPNHTPGKIKTSDERRRVWELLGVPEARWRRRERGNLFYILARAFVWAKPRKKSTGTCREYGIHHSIIVSGGHSNFEQTFFRRLFFYCPFSSFRFNVFSLHVINGGRYN